ncbi:hypothetical protein BCJMU10_1057 [Bacillus cereus]|nr:hypothetical protein BCJMU10_1057 [Bacillus cereus]
MIVRIFNENYNKMMSKGRLKVLIEFLEFISILALVVVLTLTVMLQDIFL